MLAVMSLGSSSQFGTFVLRASDAFATFEQDAIIIYAMFQMTGCGNGLGKCSISITIYNNLYTLKSEN
jgi:hypothetical protein